MSLALSLLGPFRAEVGGAPANVRSKRARALIGALAFSSDARQSRAALCALLWPGRDETQARSSLRQELSALRKALGAVGAEAVCANGEAVWLDRDRVVSDFWRLRADDWTDLPEGAFLADLEAPPGSFGDWLEEQRRAVDTEIARAGRARLDGLTERGDWATAGRLEAAILRRSPYDEAAMTARLRALCAQGRRAEATAEHDRFAALLKTDLGAEPDAALAEIVVEKPVEKDEASDIFARGNVLLMAFENLSPADEGGFIAIALVEDLRTNLAHWRWFPVIGPEVIGWKTARDSDLRETAKGVGATYVVNGSVRFAGERIRITANLTDAGDGRLLWSQSFDGTMEDIFDFQEEVSRAIVARVVPELTHAEALRVTRSRPTLMAAWQLMAQCDEIEHKSGGGYGTNEQNEAQESLVLRALEIEPDYSRAWARLAKIEWRRFLMGWSDDREASMTASMAASQKAIGFDPADWEAHAYHALTHVFGRHAFGPGRQHAEEAVRLNPSAVLARHGLACVLVWMGEPEPAIRHVDALFRLNPNHANKAAVLGERMLAEMMLGERAAAVATAQQVVSLSPDYVRGIQRAAAVFGWAGEAELARDARDRLKALLPEFDEAYVRGTYPFLHETHLEMVLDGLRRAGCLA